MSDDKESESVHFGSMSAYDLIDKLDKAYPHQCISPLDTIESAHRYGGKRELIDELLAAKREELSGEGLEAPRPKRARRKAR